MLFFYQRITLLIMQQRQSHSNNSYSGHSYSDHSHSSHSGKGHIAVIGAAIAGLSAALGAANAGYQVTIYGKVPAIAPGALQLAPNGFAALDALDALPAITPLMTRLHAIEVKSINRNATLAVIDHEAPIYRDYASLSRLDLIQSLAKLCENHDAISFQDQDVTALQISDQTSHVISNKNSNKDKTAYDIIIGADGQGGLSREIVTGEAHKNPIERGPVAWRAAVPADHLPDHFSLSRTRLWLGDGCHLVCYPFNKSQSDDGQEGLMVNLVLCVTAPNPARNPIQDPQHYLSSQAVFAPLCKGEIQWVKTALPPASQLSTWRRHNLVLTGDAAHSMPPHLAQGAGQTLEDAATLSSLLAHYNSPQDVAGAFAIERARALAPIIKRAGATGTIMRLSGPFGALRNAAIEMGGTKMIEGWLKNVWQ